jgi:transposase InsO family protein
VTFQFIRDHREHFPVRLMCRVLEASPSGFYDWLRRPESQRAAEDRALIEKIQAVHNESRRTYGSPRGHASLKAAGYRIGRKRVARLMRENDIRPRTKRKFKVTTDSRHDHPIAPNLLDRQFTVEAPNTVWLADLSYIWTREGWLYLAVVLDLFSRQVVGWAMDEQMPQELTPGHGAPAAPAAAWPDAPLRSRQSICRRCLPETARRARHRLFDEPQRKLLGTRQGQRS